MFEKVLLRSLLNLVPPFERWKNKSRVSKGMSDNEKKLKCKNKASGKAQI
jgi:hypothetical protein